MVTDVMHSVSYRLEPTGRLTVTEGGGAIEGGQATPVHTANIDEMNRHLPAEYALQYNPPPPEKPEQDFEDIFR